MSNVAISNSLFETGLVASFQLLIPPCRIRQKREELIADKKRRRQKQRTLAIARSVERDANGKEYAWYDGRGRLIAHYDEEGVWHVNRMEAIMAVEDDDIPPETAEEAYVVRINMLCTTVGRTTRGQGARLGREGSELCHSELGRGVNELGAAESAAMLESTFQVTSLQSESAATSSVPTDSPHTVILTT